MDISLHYYECTETLTHPPSPKLNLIQTHHEVFKSTDLVDMVCTQGLGHRQPAVVDVGDHNLGSTNRLRRQQVNQP